jgi:hypothetical protein
MQFKRIREAALQEIEVTKSTIGSALRIILHKKTPYDSSGSLKSAFYRDVAYDVAKRFKDDDAKYCGNQGIILKLDNGQLRRGDDELQLRAFIDVVVEYCTTLADKIDRSKVGADQRVFANIFATDSEFPHLKAEVRDDLVKAFQSVSQA